MLRRRGSFRIGIVVEETGLRTKPLLIYDGDCGFCRRWIARWRLMTGDRVDYEPYQQAADSLPYIPLKQFETAAQLVEPDGQVFSGAHAVFRTLAQGEHTRWPLWLYRHGPGIAPLTELVYRLVAKHRVGCSRLTDALWGRHLGPPSYFLTRWLFIRLMGIIYLIAFVSLGVQILGLVGSHGILPAADYLQAVQTRMGSEAYWRLPTLLWINSSDEFLQLLCWGGAGLSLLVVFRIAPGPLLVLLWVFYLSLYRVGQTFLSFQWDLLLLEAGFLAIFFAPWRLWPRLRNDLPPSRIMRWLVVWLLFRLMFVSGLVKLLDDNPADPTWHELTALVYHYETTCIPTPLSWYAHQLPLWFQKFGVVAMFVIEIGVPFLFFLPRRPRLFAFLLQVLFQLLIIATGNYNFFNLLTIALCFALLDDGYLRRVLPRRLGRAVPPDVLRRRRPRLRAVVTVPVAIVILLVSGVWMAHTLREDRTDRRLNYGVLPQTAQRVVQFAMRFQSINSYGLFRSMTTRRAEIIVEGSNDRRTWLAYEFKWKPGDVKRRPPQVAPHQPRLDWQMWFAALGRYQQSRNQWFLRFLNRLLEGTPEVLALLDTNPFPDAPPRYVRAVLYDYHFTDWETQRATGAWWKRKRLHLYTPVLSLESFRRR